MKKFFKYLEPTWTGTDGKMSLRSVLAIAFSIDFISNLSHAIYKWDVGRSLEGLSLTLGIEGGLIVALLGLTTYQNLQTTISDNNRNQAKIDIKDPVIEQVTIVDPKNNNNN